MKLEELAGQLFDIAEKSGVPHMAVGAIAAGTYGIPRATKDIDFLVATDDNLGIRQLIEAFRPLVEFDPQVQFDTLTWGKRWVGVSTTTPHYKVELFEMFDDPFVQSEFSRRTRTYVPILGREIHVPTAEDIVVQKLRWARPKDLDDARDVLAVQGPENLDMSYIEKWCGIHGTMDRLHRVLAEIPPL
ncbi:nucleotidyl transferase AbiEii/AbiGii toxin family protein [Luteolibacter flavescens]|uniref:Nucleotidyl transferase AbiEii/AbiGii toxin family protein n=1 Tax=Luteolibacter flavescens TaxID=1859460 RepID=A0ABT3FTG5_9BACT|nr:nucleotidyl transferase AbiEii/AbiGii toxin family protein [Luteolibacter flavescens]MCW1886285.1 nucleotidyl transferase AbiEii/AbiGii toxin family protein [Luteolibacter flavescens]